MLRNVLAVAIGVAASGASASAQDVLFLVPRAGGAADSAGAVLVAPELGSGREWRVTDAADAVDWYYARSLGYQENKAAAPLEGGKLRFLLRGDELRVVGLDTRPVIVERPSGEVAALYAAAGLTARRATTRLREYRSAKTIVRAPGASRPTISEVAFSKSGQRAEIRPLTDPTAMPVGADIPMVVYVDGINTAGIEVIAEHVASGARQILVSGRAGSTHLTLSSPGEWRLQFARAAAPPDPDPDGVELNVHLGTLVFVAAGDAQGDKP